MLGLIRRQVAPCRRGSGLDRRKGRGRVTDSRQSARIPSAQVEVRWHNSVVPSQNYANHAHRPTMTVLAGACLLVAIIGFVMQWRRVGGMSASGIGLAGLTAAVAMLVSISRQYTTRLQDRIIRLEMRVRCAPFLAPEQQRALQALDLRRIAALRFASVTPLAETPVSS